MTTQQTTPVRRIFKYGDKTFPDPGPEYSVAQILAHLKTFLPELGHARTEERELADGTLEITFSKQVTRKGAVSRRGAVDDPTSQTAAMATPVTPLTTALAAIPPYDNPLTPVYAALAQEGTLTLHILRQHTQLLHDHLDLLRDQTAAMRKVLVSCKAISPTPLPQRPWGF